MRKYLLVILGGVFLATVSCALSNNSHGVGVTNPYGPQDISSFYDYLSPFGSWTEYTPYGYVWCPNDMGFRWRPYMFGRWLSTDFGWTWFSDEEWGWIPYHYGRWGWDAGLGWFWVPDTVWGPAWVSWRWGDLYAGWAPLPPGAGFDIGIGLRRQDFDIDDRSWVFVRENDFMDEHLNRRVLPYERNRTVVGFTQPTTNIYVRGTKIFNDGPDIRHIQSVTGRDVVQFNLKDAKRPGLNRVEAQSLMLYRPAISENKTARPRNVLRRNEAEGRIGLNRAAHPGQTTRPRHGKQQRDQSIANDHQMERTLLENTQKEELDHLQQQSESLKRQVQTAEKQRIENESAAKANELRKKHEEERTQLNERHRQEEQAGQGGGKQGGEESRRKGKG